MVEKQDKEALLGLIDKKFQLSLINTLALYDVRKVTISIRSDTCEVGMYNKLIVRSILLE